MCILKFLRHIIIIIYGPMWKIAYNGGTSRFRIHANGSGDDTWRISLKVPLKSLPEHPWRVWFAEGIHATITGGVSFLIFHRVSNLLQRSFSVWMRFSCTDSLRVRGQRHARARPLWSHDIYTFLVANR